MIQCLFSSDLHGKIPRYEKLFKIIRDEKPSFVFLGGDLLPHAYSIKSGVEHFIDGYLFNNFSRLRESMKDDYPEVFVILGNDDPKVNEKSFIDVGKKSGLWTYLHNRKVQSGKYTFYGYAIVPPTPFRLKDWEKYDVSRNIDPGCIDPMEGFRSVEAEKNIQFSTIQKDIEILTKGDDLENAVFLFHSPPYKTNLDRAALDGQMVDYVPLDVHVGSIAIQRFLKEKQPLLSMHGHIHESTRITGKYYDLIGKTIALNGSTDNEKFCAVRFDLNNPRNHSAELV